MSGTVAPLTPPFIGTRTSCLLVKVGQAVFRLMEQMMQQLGLRTRHYSVLKTVDELGAMSQQQLGEYLRIDRATMVSCVDDLERLGHVERRRDPADRRRYAVGITPKGRTTVAQADKLLRELDEEVLVELSSDQRGPLHEGLHALSFGQVLPQAFDRVRDNPNDAA